jgi:UDP-N-acetylglucosamine 1-carboxyvinyltransferase
VGESRIIKRKKSILWLHLQLKNNNMPSFKIVGSRSLSGEITPQGAKNEALQILCAVMLTAEPITIHNIPNIRDVNQLIDLLGDLGVKRTRLSDSSVRFEASDINLEFMETEMYRKKAAALRGSVMLLGPMLARFKKGRIPRPGGDKIGRRRLDTHFLGFEKLGAKFDYDPNDGGFYQVDASNLHGTYMLLDEASVTGTANILMAAVMAEGTTTIYNAACEPYLQQLCKMLNRMGAKIGGLGSNLLTIEGVSVLHGTNHTMLPDMIEIGSFIGMAAMTRSQITIKNCSIPDLGIIPTVFQRLGIQLEIRGDDIFVPAQDHYEVESFIDGSMLVVADAPWPGFTPDLLSIVLVTAIQAKGTVLIHQKMFESRLFFVDKLIEMGAQIILCDPHRATVVGLNRSMPLRGIRMTSPDIRAGVSLLIAALSAKGVSIIDNIEQIDRGYQNIDTRLTALGAEIVRL